MLIDVTLSGVTLGGMYALVAMGLTLQYGVARIMNLSYGELLIAAAFAAHWLFSAAGVGPLAGLLFVVPGVMLVLFGGAYYSYSYLALPVHVLGATLAANRLVALAFAAVIGVLLWLGLTRTRAGTAVRAVAVDPVSAQLVAIDVRSTAALAFALGGAL